MDAYIISWKNGETTWTFNMEVLLEAMADENCEKIEFQAHGQKHKFRKEVNHENTDKYLAF